MNVLITGAGRACLADFGLATVMDSKTITVTNNQSSKKGGTLRWQAPELFNGDAEEASDIYAFACICYEVWCPNVFMIYQCLTLLQMFSGEIPFHEKRYEIEVLYSVLEGKRPDRPLHTLSKTRGLSDEVWSIIETCWSQEPAKRPTAKQVVLQLQALPCICIDARPPDDFDTNFPSQTLYNHTDHPFSALSAANYVILASRSGNLPNSGCEPKDEEKQTATDERLKQKEIQGSGGLVANLR